MKYILFRDILLNVGKKSSFRQFCLCSLKRPFLTRPLRSVGYLSSCSTLVAPTVEKIRNLLVLGPSTLIVYQTPRRKKEEGTEERRKKSVDGHRADSRLIQEWTCTPYRAVEHLRSLPQHLPVLHMNTHHSHSIPLGIIPTVCR